LAVVLAAALAAAPAAAGLMAAATLAAGACSKNRLLDPRALANGTLGKEGRGWDPPPVMRDLLLQPYVQGAGERERERGRKERSSGDR